jgi:hypothetical protein
MGILYLRGRKQMDKKHEDEHGGKGTNNRRANRAMACGYGVHHHMMWQ